ncbi:LacI family DNA-binding transcriptional regulator [Microbispora sp. H10836]|uniref:LacI family DNA-binding transcriptional regulator n=1 Tax=Microbispora sp. H10836 TaxID=2729106 RepID=UPI0014749C5A|nr:LacI family DNA-binding transcriptional regulator [Microbispora sp. H10836]
MLGGGRLQGRRGLRRGDLTVAAIAQLAGVSPPTVSKVLHGRAGVGESTRKRVEALLREHGYRRPVLAGSARGLEVVFSNMLGSIAIEIMRGVEQVAATRQLGVGFTDVRSLVTAGLPWVEPLLLRQPVGVIAVVSEVTTEHRELFEASGVPLVALDPTGDVHPTPSVGSTSWSGALAATRHLLELGHRRIGLITGPAGFLATRARLDGFRAALDTAGVPFDERLMRSGPFLFEHGRDLGSQLLTLPDPPTAVVCGNDLQAFGVYEAARLLGLRIPDDLSVVGFDDIEHCEWVAPALTTVRQPFLEIGATAARIALALADGDRPSRPPVELGAALVVRDSTAPPRSA